MAYLIATAAHMQLCGHGDGAREEQQDHERVDPRRQVRVDPEILLDGGRDQVEEGEHGDHGQEHGVVDHGRVAVVGVVDDVAC